MSVSSEWNALKAAWLIMLLFLVARVFLSGQFLLTPEEALYWQAGLLPQTADHFQFPILTWLIKLSTSIFGNNEFAVRLPALLSVTLASFYIALTAATMFSWHTGLHVTWLSQGVLQLNLAAMIISPHSLVLTCWSAACYHTSQALHNNRTGEWLFAGLWFGTGLLCDFSMALLLPCIALCFVAIKPFRTCLLYPGPWLGFILSLSLYFGVFYWLDKHSPVFQVKNLTLEELKQYLTPELSDSLQFLYDQAVMLTPLIFLLIVIAWFTGQTRRHMVDADERFLTYTSFPLFLLLLFFPNLDTSGITWTAPVYISALILIAGLHSSTRSNFKGRPKRRWVLGCLSAYLVSIPLLLQLAYPAFHLPVNISQTNFMIRGWDTIGKEINNSLQQMPAPKSTFLFCMEPRITGELSFYTPGHPTAVSLDYVSLSQQARQLQKHSDLSGMDGIGVITTQAALKKIRSYFDRVELERELRLQSPGNRPDTHEQLYYIVKGFGFRVTTP